MHFFDTGAAVNMAQLYIFLSHLWKQTDNYALGLDVNVKTTKYDLIVENVKIQGQSFILRIPVLF